MIKLMIVTTLAIFIGFFLQKSSYYSSFTYNNLLIEIPVWLIVMAFVIFIGLNCLLLNIALRNWLQNRRAKPLLLKLTTVYQTLNDWQGLIKLLPYLKKYQIYKVFDYQQLEFMAYQKRIEQLSATGSVDVVVRFFKELPTFIKQNSQFVMAYVNCLIQLKNFELAEKIIKNHLSNSMR